MRLLPLAIGLLSAAEAGGVSDPRLATLARIEPSATRGVAPLPVFFDALGSTLADGTPHDAEYCWDFGDLGSSHPAARGFCAAHVFERPGTFKVRLSLRDRAGTSASAETTIEVKEFAGTTFWVSRALGDDRHDGRSPEHPLANYGKALALAVQHLRRGGPAVALRVLFRRGETYQVPGPAQVPSHCAGAPLLVGAYGEGERPVLQATRDSPLLEAGESVSGLRFVDLDLRGRFSFATKGGGEHEPLLRFHGGRDLLVLRCALSSAACGIAVVGKGSAERREITVCDTTIEECRDYCAYLGGERLAVLGCRFARVSEMHVLRLWYARRAVVADNELLDPSVHSGLGRHALKAHSYAGGRDDPPIASEWLLVAGNTFRGAAWPVEITPQNRESIEPITNVVVERNRFLADELSSTPTNQMLTLCARDVTVRDNAFLGNERCGELLGIAVESYPLLPPCANVRVIGNTLLHPGGGKDAYLQFLAVRGRDTSGVVVERNLARATVVPRARVALVALQGGAVSEAVRERGNLSSAGDEPPLDAETTAGVGASGDLLRAASRPAVVGGRR